MRKILLAFGVFFALSMSVKAGTIQDLITFLEGIKNDSTGEIQEKMTVLMQEPDGTMRALILGDSDSNLWYFAMPDDAQSVGACPFPEVTEPGPYEKRWCDKVSGVAQFDLWFTQAGQPPSYRGTFPVPCANVNSDFKPPLCDI